MECCSAKKKKKSYHFQEKPDVQHHVKQNKPGSKQQISHVLSDVWHLDLKKNIRMWE